MATRSAARKLPHTSFVPHAAVTPRLWSVDDAVPWSPSAELGEAPAGRGVVVIDADPLTRAGMRALLARQEDLLVRDFANLDLAATAVRLAACSPHLILVEASLAAESGGAGLRSILAVLPTAKVIAFGTGSREEELFRVFDAGASGYLLRGSAEAELERAIRCVEAGGRYVPPQAEATLKRRQARRELTPRETDVLRLLAQARSNAAIAAALGIAPGTAKLHVKSVMAKLGVEDRAEAALVAIERGFVRLAET